MNDEKAFQYFFEKNPAMLPGAFGFFGESGHAPHNNALITQPVLQGLTTKVPDFLWIASDSLNIYPVFIEIEAPSKKWFNKDGTQTAKFTQAQSQLQDWKAWYSNPTRDIITCQVKNRDYFAKYVSPTFRLGPVFAEELNKINNKEEAILNTELTDERKKFLIPRLKYWEDFGKKKYKGLMNSGDWE